MEANNRGEQVPHGGDARSIEQELRASEARLRSIVESALDAIVSIDADNRIVEFNPAAEGIFGWRREQVLGRDMGEVLIPPGLREAHRQGLARHLHSPSAPRLGVRLELVALRADGTQFPIELTVTRTATEALPQFTAFIRDLTALRRTQAEAQRLAEELKASELQYRSLFVSHPQPMAVYDPVTLRHLAVNTAGLQQYGYTQAEFLQMTILDLCPAEDRATWDQQVLSAPLAGRRQYRGRHRHKSGRLIHVDVYADDIVFEGRRARVVLAIDVTERRQAARELRESEARFRALTELSADWYWEQDAEFRFVDIHGGPRWPLGISPAGNILGKRRWELEGTEPDGGDWEAHRRTLERHEPFRDFIIRRRAADGRIRVLSLSGIPILDRAGRFKGYRGVGRDVTEAQHAQEEIARLNGELEERVRQRTAQLEAANRELEAFSYSIAHDLRSPLTSIDGFSHVLEVQHDAHLPPQARHCVRRIRAGVRQMSELTDALLALAHLSRVHLRDEPVDLAASAREVLAALQEREPGRPVELHIPEHLPARGDPRLLTQVMANLLGNAWKFSARKPQTCVRVGSRPGAPGETVYFVEDHGAGFDMAYASRLFGAFQRLHGPSEFEGTGIGLALVQKIVSRHGGRVWAEARPGEGATFYFTLPTASAG